MDSSFSFVLIVADHVNEKGNVVEWTAHRNTNQTKIYRSATSSGWITTCDQSRGCYDGVGRIVWEDSTLDKWNRVNITSHQWHFMTYRPYIPMTIVVFAMLRQCVLFMYNSCKSIVITCTL